MPAPPWTVAPKRRKGPFPTSGACCCFSAQPSGEKSSLLHTCVQARTRGPARPVPPCSRILPCPQAAAAPCVSSQVTPAARTCPAAVPQPVRAQTPSCSSPWALSGDTLPPPQHAFSLSPSTCFLWFHPYFSRQKHSPSLHLPSLYGSQLFFLLFSASYYPGAKNNKEFTALDLELGQAQCSSFCCVSKVLNGSSWVFLASLQVLSPGGTAQHWDAALTGISCETCCELVMLREVRRALWAWGSGVVCEPRSSSPQDVMGFLVFVLSSHVFSLSL